MTKTEIIRMLEGEIEYLKSSEIPEELDLSYQVDEGGYTDGACPCTDFSVSLDYDEEEGLVINFIVERNDEI